MELIWDVKTICDTISDMGYKYMGYNNYLGDKYIVHVDNYLRDKYTIWISGI